MEMEEISANNINAKLEEIRADYADRIRDHLHAFDAAFRQSLEGGYAPNIDTIETYVELLDAELKKTFASMLSEYIAAAKENKPADEEAEEAEEESGSEDKEDNS